MRIGAIAFAAAILLAGLVYASMGMDMPRGTLAYPGPGFFPTVIGVFLVATALGCLVQEIVGREPGDARPPAQPPSDHAAPRAERRLHKTFQLIALLVAYGYALKPLGFPIAIFLFSAVAIRIFGYRRVVPTLAVAAAIAVVSHVVFVVWLKVALPVGLLEALLD